MIYLDKLADLIEDAFYSTWTEDETPEIVERLERLHSEFKDMYFGLWKVAEDARTIRKGRSEGGIQAVRAREAKSETTRETHKKMRDYADSLRGKHPPYRIRSLVAKRFACHYETARRILPA